MTRSSTVSQPRWLYGCNLSLLIFLSCALLYYAWIGFLASDDWGYLEGALGWMNEPPYVGKNHWELRHTLTIPASIFFRLFGVNEFTLVLPTALSYLGMVAVTYFALSRYAGQTTANIAAVLVLTTPVFATFSTTAIPDVIETFWVVVSFWFFYAAVSEESEWKRKLFFAGIAAGLAWLTRETSLVIILFYALLFIAGYGIPRSRYTLIAAGFLLPTIVELAYFFATTGDPFYRLHIDFHHDTVHRGQEAAFTFDHSGNLVIHPLLNPFLVFFLSHEFILLFYAAVPIGVVICTKHVLGRNQTSLARLLCLLAISWAAFIIFTPSSLYLNPRYFSVTAYVAALLIALWAGNKLVQSNSRRTTLLLLLALITTNLAGVYLDNKHPKFAERTLIKLATERHEVIYTDPISERRLRKFLVADPAIKLVAEVKATPPEPGALFYYAKDNIQTARQEGLIEQVADYSPGPGWIEVWKTAPERKLAGWLIEKLGLDPVLPDNIYRKINQTEPTVMLYRRAGGQ